MPTNEEVKLPEGGPAAQHRFRISVNANPSENQPENGPNSANSSRQPPGEGPFLLPYRNSRYKEKFQALREKYDRVTAKQEEYHHDLEIATAKIKKLQAENDLLLDAMNLVATHQPSMFPLLGALDDVPMDLDAFAGPSTSAVPLVAERPPPRHINGNGNGNGNGHSSTGTRSGSNSSFGPVQTNGNHPPPEHSRQPSMEFIAHDMNGRAP